MVGYGFIITRHVNSETTNKYWNHCVQCIRKRYPYRKIIVIDDNSDAAFIAADFPYRNVEVVQSEYPARGELLPYLYFLKNRPFEAAVMIHDSVFLRKRIPFESLAFPVIPMWHFPPDTENKENLLRIASALKNSAVVKGIINKDEIMMPIKGRADRQWRGAFGVMCYIRHDFLANLEKKYGFTALTSVVKCRTDRCGLERIMAILFYAEFPGLLSRPSLLGPIFQYMRWGTTFDEYIDNGHGFGLPVVKVWSGR